MRVALVFALCLLGSAGAGAAPPATFRASIEPLSAGEQDRMKGRSWNEGCPVPLADLVAIHLNHIGFDHAVHDGVLVVHRRLAKEVSEVFHALFDAGFQIERMQPYEDFPVGEYAASNDSVGFYCRPAQDDPSTFSWHAYGVAIDLNPMTNPYHDPRGWWPKGSDGDRARSATGLITARSTAVQVFMAHGWAWGGLDNAAPDYMHFGKVTIGGGSDPLKRQVWAERLEYAPN
jgi:D-alanyl-D-alanine carboxypeptidase